jgi:plastocyanin
MRRPAALVFGALALPSCGGGDGDGGVAGTRQEPVTEVTVTSPDVSFDLEAIYVPAGEEITLIYDNEDKGVAHNIHVKHEAANGEDPRPRSSPAPTSRSSRSPCRSRASTGTYATSTPR